MGAHEAPSVTLALRPEPALPLLGSARPGPFGCPAGSLPPFPIDLEWKAERRLWGHAFHPMCSYLAAFPAGLAHAFIARYTRPGDVVLDPFSGRGTTALQACAEGRVGVGNDLNPLAHLLTGAKVDPPEPDALFDRLADLRAAWPAAEPGLADVGGPVPTEVAACFHPRTLAQLGFLRASLDPADPVDRFIAATTTGVLHGRGRAFLSGLMPNAFSMPATYVLRYARDTGYVPEPRDVFAVLDAKSRRLLRDPLPPARGISMLGDARDAGTRARRLLESRSLPGRVRLVVTSPPYLRVVRYGSANWLRLWFLGLDPADVDAALDQAHRPAAYLRFLREVLADLRRCLADDAVVALVLGDVESDRGHRLRRKVTLADRAWEESAEPEGYRLAGVAIDEIAAHRKSTRIWGDEAGRATRVDRLLVVAPSEQGRRRALASASFPVDWTWPPRPRLRLVVGQGSR
jgi:DNA methylase